MAQQMLLLSPLRQLLLLLALLQLTPCPSTGQQAANNLCDGDLLRSILRGVDQPSCLARGGKQNCSMMRHLEQLAETEGRPLDYIVSRATVLVFAHSEFIQELTVPGNPVLEMEAELAQHYAFIGVTKCLKASDSTCQQLRLACLGGISSQFIFLVSGHCSKSWGCSTIYPTDRDKPSTMLNLLPYLHFRLLERQAFIAMERGELQLSTSITTEYLIQTELNDTYGSQLIREDSKPVAVFVAGMVKTLTYYQQLAWFLDTSLRLKHLFAFHVVTTPLSQLESESERPLLRWKINWHESYLALYTKRMCNSDPTWAFSCKPQIITSRQLMFGEQYVSFLLHWVLSDAALAGDDFPVVRFASKYLDAFVRESKSYVLAVMPVDELLTDPRMNWELLKSLVPYLGSSFGVTYKPLVLSKATALQALKGVVADLDLEQAFYRPSIFIRLANGDHAVLMIDQPIAALDKTVRDAANGGRYQIALQSARELLSNPQLAELPEGVAKSGHIFGDAQKGDDDVRDLLDSIRVKNRTDAFVEQLNFRDIYNVTGVLVVESDPELMRHFFDKLGRDKPWLVLFTVSWSPLCKAARAVWSSVSQCARRLGFPDVQLVKVDCFEANEICQTLKITSFPTISMFSRGIQLNTYSGPIVSNDLCLYTKLAFQPPALTSSSESETQQLLEKILSTKSRTFVFRGTEMSSQMAAAVKSLRFREVFIHEKSAGIPAELSAVYSSVRPGVNRYSGPLDDSAGLLDFVANGHLSSVFPCTWEYLPQALRQERPLVILYHLDSRDDTATTLLEGLHGKFGSRAAFCQLNMRSFVHLSDLVRQLAGLSLPALVALTKPPGAAGKVTHRLALGAVPSAELLARTMDWLERVLTHLLVDGRPVEPDEKWQPASQVFNFVDQVYHGKTEPGDGGHRMHSSRAFTVQEDVNTDGDTMASKKILKESPMSGTLKAGGVSSKHEEL